MELLWTCIFILICTSHAESGKTDEFLAVQNYQGYSQDLLLETVRKYYPDTSLDHEELSKILEVSDIQKSLRDSAVQESARKLEKQEKTSRNLEPPLDDPSYCGYYWLSWLPWLGCSRESREISPIYVSDEVCTPRKHVSYRK